MNKSTLISVGIFLLLLGVVIWNATRAPERGITRITFEDVDPEAIDRVEITGKNSVKLTQEGELWRVESGKEADANSVKRLVEAIPKIVSTDLVTSDAQRFAELEVDEEKGAQVKAFAGDKQVASFVVGKSARGGSHVRVGDEVYAVKQIYSSTFSREASTWLQRKLFNDKLADVKRVEVALKEEKPFALVKKDNTWELEDPSAVPANFRFDSSQAASLASALLNARAKDILDADPGEEKTQLAGATDNVAFVVEEGEGDSKSTVRRELKLGAALDDKSVYARVSGKEDVITLPEYTAKNLRKKPTDFRNLKMMEVDHNKVSKLDIRNGSLRLVLEKQGAEWKIASSSEPIPDDFTLDPSLVTRRLSALANARATKVADRASGAGLSSKVSVTATLEDKSTAAIIFGKEIKEDNQDLVYASGNADANTYLVTKWTRKNLTGGLSTFKKQQGDASGMSNIDPKALQNLPPDVRASLMKQLQQKQQQQRIMERLQRQAEQAKKEDAKAASSNN